LRAGPAALRSPFPDRTSERHGHHALGSAWRRGGPASAWQRQGIRKGSPREGGGTAGTHGDGPAAFGHGQAAEGTADANQRTGSNHDDGAGGGVVAKVGAWVAKPGAGIFLLGATLAFAVLGASEQVGRAVRTMKQDNVIRVKGVAELDVTSDRAAWWGTVRARAATLPAAYDELAKATDALQAFVLGKGVPATAITVASVSIERERKKDDKGNETNAIGKLVDAAMDAIEHDNPTLQGVLPKIYAKPDLDKPSLGKLIDLVSGIGLGTSEHRAKDTLGRVYEYFLARFAGAEGKGGGEFYTPNSVVQTLVELIEPYEGRIYDPCCGSGGMFVQSLKFLDAYGGKKDRISIYGQESNPTTWRLARMNLAIRGIGANLGAHHADTFRKDLHPDLRADFLLANPPFNISEWHGETLRDDVRWKYGVPPVGNANFAWVQHFLHHLAPNGIAGFVLANGSMSSNQSGEGDIRKAIVEADLVDCIVAMPGQLFYATQIPVCLWVLAKNKADKKFRDRRGHTLFLDARKLGRMETRVHRVLDASDVQRIAGAYHGWRSKDGKHEDVPGFAKSAPLAEIQKHGHVLTPGRYVGAEDVEDDGEGFEAKMQRLATTLRQQQAEAAKLDAAIAANLKELGYGQ
jgi:type I restriction enzyme M protein